MPNGIIIMYEIHYKEASSNKMYNMYNTTSPQYTINQLNDSSAFEIKVKMDTLLLDQESGLLLLYQH